jgi:hypothetical protein
VVLSDPACTVAIDCSTVGKEINGPYGVATTWQHLGSSLRMSLLIADAVFQLDA